ncbi:MAG: beta-propeller domain-containing protein [Micrococcales bacterium]|nr:beta-propeller domain-containing protein [Micrococcales bacterium]
MNDPIFRDMADQMTPDDALLHRLDQRLAAESTAPTTERSAQDAPAPTRRGWRSRPTTWVAAAAVTALAVTGVGIELARHDQPGGTLSATELGVVMPDSYDELYEAVVAAVAAGSTTAGPDVTTTGEVTEDTVAAAPGDSNAPSSARAPGTGDHTTTNVQVAGIDEADVVKSDGKHLYAAIGPTVRIVRLDGPDTHQVARINLPGIHHLTGANEMLLTDRGTLVVIGQTSTTSSDNLRRWSGECDLLDLGSPYPDWCFTPHVITQTTVWLYDVSDPSRPSLRATASQSGTYRTARLLDGMVYLVSEHHISQGAINRTAPATFVPMVSGDDGMVPLPVSDVVVLPAPGGGARFAVATAIDTRTGERLGQQAAFGGADTVYMSEQNLYLGGYTYHAGAFARGDVLGRPLPAVGGASTMLVRVALNEGALTVAAHGSVPGSLVNQLALDEHDGHLRVATTSRDYETTSDLYVLDKNLRLVGSIRLMRDESVRSVRFTGEVGYVVTFRDTDPLFALDLSDPTAPRIMSALKIPGFSSYLHPWGDGWLVGLGYIGDDWGLTGGIKLSLFDISNPYDVTEAHEMPVLGTTGPGTRVIADALHDHRAVFVDEARGVIGFAVGTVTHPSHLQGPGQGSYQRSEEALRFLVYGVGPDGFTLLHDLPLAAQPYSYYGTFYDQAGVRAVRSDDHLYVVWSGGVNVFHATSGAPTALVTFG